MQTTTAQTETNRQQPLLPGFGCVGDYITRNCTDAKGQNTGCAYDALNRLTNIDYDVQGCTSAGGAGCTGAAPGTTDDVTMTYDQGINGIGRLTQMTDASGITDYSYDKRGNLIKQSHANGTVLYGYDSANRIIGMTYPSGRRVSYSYDTLGRVSSVSTIDATGKTQVLANNMSYRPFGPRTGLTYGNGLVMTRQFDLDGRLTAQEIQGTSIIQSLQFAYNAADNIINKTNLADTARSQAYDYDELDRLVSASGIYGNIGYGYDSVGNRLTKSQTAGSETYSYAATSNRLSGITDTNGTKTYQYDANGNTTAKNTEQFIYNAENRLIEYRGSTTATYVYNAQGQRMGKNSAQGTSRFIYNQQGQMIGEYGSTGNAKEYVYIGGEPLAIIENNNIYYVHNDHLATPQQMTDQSGAAVWAVDYKPFGEVTTTTSTVENNLRFPGQYFDQESGNHYNYYRDYDPRTGRYVESDPMSISDHVLRSRLVALLGLEASNRFPLELNPYAYVGGNPLTYIDPLGLWRWPGEIYDEAAKDAQRRFPNSTWNGPGDAYRHCLASCMVTRENSTLEATVLGWANEKRGDWRRNQERSERAMDDFNNAVGRQCGQSAQSTQDCVNGCLSSDLMQYQRGTTPGYWTQTYDSWRR